jgi:hypothetical protein
VEKLEGCRWGYEQIAFTSLTALTFAATAISSNIIHCSRGWSGNRNLSPNRSAVSTTGAAHAGSAFFADGCLRTYCP